MVVPQKKDLSQKKKREEWAVGGVPPKSVDHAGGEDVQAEKRKKSGTLSTSNQRGQERTSYDEWACSLPGEGEGKERLPVTCPRPRGAQ